MTLMVYDTMIVTVGIHRMNMEYIKILVVILEYLQLTDYQGHERKVVQLAKSMLSGGPLVSFM